MNITEVESAIYNIYQQAHRDRPGSRLNPEIGPLGELWAEFDRLILTEGGE